MKKGINTVKESLTAIATVVQTVDEALEDKKVNLVESIRIALKSLNLIKVLKDVKESKAELLELDGAEKSELKEHFVEVFKLRNEDAEKAVEGIITLAIDLSDNLVLLQKKKS